MKMHCLQLTAAGCLAVVLASTSAFAQSASENFNSFDDGTEYLPNTAPGGFVSVGNQGDSLSLQTSDTAESPFTGVAGGLGLVYADTSPTSGSGTGIRFDLGQGYADALFTVQFDYQPITAGLALTVVGSSGTTVAGSYARLDGEVGYQVDAGVTRLGTLLNDDTWYRIAITYDVSSTGNDAFAIAVTPHGGSTVSYTALPFRNGVGSIRYINIVHNGSGVAQGSYSIDNFMVYAGEAAAIPEPASAGLLVGGMIAVCAICRRPRR